MRCKCSSYESEYLIRNTSRAYEFTFLSHFEQKNRFNLNLYIVQYVIDVFSILEIDQYPIVCRSTTQ